MWQDIRYALRTLARNPAFTLVAVAALSLGIGANTTIVTVVNAIVLEPLKFENPEQLVSIREDLAKLGRPLSFPVSPVNFLDYRAENHVFSHMSVIRNSAFNYSDGVEPVRLQAVLVSADFFELLGVKPFLGRGFLDAENDPGKNQVVVLSHGLCMSHFGGRRDIVGQSIRLDDKPYIVVGVSPAGFQYPPQAELWSPFVFGPQELQARGFHYVGAIARLRPGVSVPQAQAELTTISKRLQKQYPATNDGVDANLRDLREEMVGKIRPALLTLLGAVTFVLLIACVNLANLLLARSAARRNEIIVRTMLGARRARLIRQLLTESVLISILGAGFGLFLASAAIRLFVRLTLDTLPRTGEIAINGPVLAFTATIGVLTGILFGLVPALKLACADLNSVVKANALGVSLNFRRNRSRSLLIVAEVALSLLLLMSAGLLMKSFYRLRSVDPGFQVRDVLTMRTNLPPVKYPRHDQQSVFYQQALDRIRALPGVTAAGAIDAFPLLAGQTLMRFFQPGKPPKPPGSEDTAAVDAVTPGYFEAMRIPLKSGRFFENRDGPGAPNVAIISETMSRRFYPGEDPVGKQLVIGASDARPAIIVGVVGDVRPLSLDAQAGPAIYQPSSQAGSPRYFAIRTAADPISLIAAIRSAIRQVDPEIPVDSVATAEQTVSNSLSQRRLTMLLMIVFAGLAVTLALIGIYGVISYSVAQATREIGIRVALGAQRKDLLTLVLGYGLTVTLAGLIIGVAIALATGRLLASQLYEVQPTDMLTFGAVSGILLAVALPACLAPAWRAMHVEPTVALRYE